MARGEVAPAVLSLLVLLFFKEAYGPPLGRSAYTGARPETRAVTNGGA